MSNDKSLVVKRVISSDKASIFEALTNEDMMNKWFFAGPDGWSAKVSSKAEVGESYRIDMIGENDTYTHTGVFKEVVPNEKIVFTWNSQAVEDTLVTITLKETSEGTEVKLVHEFMPNEEQVKNHTQGWTVILERLEHTVTG